MLIPKCCKGCSGRKNGVCNCTLPTYCQEYVEDEEVIKPITYMTTSDTFMKNLGNWVKCPDCEDKDKEIKRLKKNLKLSRVQKKNWCNKKKDHQIAVLEKALWLMSKQLDFIYNEEWCVYYDKIGGCADNASELMNAYIKRAEKELEGKDAD